MRQMFVFIFVFALNPTCFIYIVFSTKYYVTSETFIYLFTYITLSTECYDKLFTFNTVNRNEMKLHPKINKMELVIFV